jgi:hypothetical protein
LQHQNTTTNTNIHHIRSNTATIKFNKHQWHKSNTP